MQNFVNIVNYHYYVLDPLVVLDEYQKWWARRIEAKPLDLEWTGLLFIICACSLQHLPSTLRPKFHSELGENVSTLSRRCYEAAQRLGAAVPAEYDGLTHVQQLLHVCMWEKAEGQYVECWHTLSHAVRCAQKLSIYCPPLSDPANVELKFAEIHQDNVDQNLTEFEREMRRRVWCLLDTWDW